MITTDDRAPVQAAMAPAPNPGPRLVSELGEGHIMTTVVREALAGSLAPGRQSPRLTSSRVTETSEQLSLQEVAERAANVLDEVERAVVGKRAALELALCALLADGHVLIEDYPGLAKTLIARSLATATGTRFSRVQFTPDLMPSDVTGVSIFDRRTAEFEFRPGPVFTNILLAGEREAAAATRPGPPRRGASIG